MEMLPINKINATIKYIIPYKLAVKDRHSYLTKSFPVASKKGNYCEADPPGKE